MPAAVLDLVESRAIEQNAYWSMKVTHPGDLTGAQLQGQIRRDYSGDLLATLRFSTPSFNAELNQTSFNVFLLAAETLAIPTPRRNEFWVYDVLLTRSGEAEPSRLLQGKVNISPGVTR